MTAEKRPARKGAGSKDAAQPGVARLRPKIRAPAASVGGWIDEGVPPRLGDLLARHCINDADGFSEWLGQHLGLYRFDIDAESQIGTPTANAEATVSVARALKAARLALNQVPALATSQASHAAHIRGLNWHDMKQALVLDLTAAEVLLAEVQ